MMQKSISEISGSSPYSVLRLLLSRNSQILQGLHDGMRRNKARRIAWKAVVLIREALEKGGKIFIVTSDAPGGHERDQLCRQIEEAGAGKRIVVIPSPERADDDRGRRVLRRLAPKPWDLVIFLNAHHEADFALGVLKEANMWHCEPVVITHRTASRILRRLSDIIVPLQAFDLKAARLVELARKSRTTTLIAFVSSGRRLPRLTGSLNES